MSKVDEQIETTLLHHLEALNIGEVNSFTLESEDQNQITLSISKTDDGWLVKQGDAHFAASDFTNETRPACYQAFHSASFRDAVAEFVDRAVIIITPNPQGDTVKLHAGDGNLNKNIEELLEVTNPALHEHLYNKKTLAQELESMNEATPSESFKAFFDSDGYQDEKAPALFADKSFDMKN